MKLIFCVLLILFATQACQSQRDFAKKLDELGITLTEPAPPIANYVKAVRSGNLLFLSGHGPMQSNGQNMTGKVGKDISLEEGKSAARLTAISLISTLKAELGDLNKVKRIVKVSGWVNCTPEFGDQPQVMNGCSDLLVSVFGDRGKHARTSLGTNALPGNIPVEIEMVVEVE